MLEREHFAKCVNALGIARAFVLSDEWLRVMYELLKPYFSNETFGFACNALLHDPDNLYAKPPDFQKFMRYCPARPKPINDLQSQAKHEFLEKVSEYLDDDYHTDHERADFAARMTSCEAACLRQLGGISRIWECVHRQDMARSVNAVLKELGDVFDQKFSSTRQDVVLLNEIIQPAIGAAGGMRQLFAPVE